MRIARGVRAALALTVLAAPAAAQFSIESHTLDNGTASSRVFGGDFRLCGTIGQPDATPRLLCGGGFELRGGHFAAGRPKRCIADWNDDGIVNTGDFLAYLNDYNLVRNGDDPINGNPDLALPAGQLNSNDLLAFLNLYLAGC